MARSALSRAVGAVAAHTDIRLWIGPWQSGLYFARLTSSDRRIGSAPFVVRPERLGTERVAVLIPAFTWQAYDYRDENRDSVSDTWCADVRRNEVELFRPFLNRGVSPHFRGRRTRLDDSRVLVDTSGNLPTRARSHPLPAL